MLQSWCSSVNTWCFKLGSIWMSLVHGRWGCNTGRQEACWRWRSYSLVIWRFWAGQTTYYRGWWLLYVNILHCGGYCRVHCSYTISGGIYNCILKVWWREWTRTECVSRILTGHGTDNPLGCCNRLLFFHVKVFTTGTKMFEQIFSKWCGNVFLWQQSLQFLISDSQFLRRRRARWEGMMVWHGFLRLRCARRRCACWHLQPKYLPSVPSLHNFRTNLTNTLTATTTKLCPKTAAAAVGQLSQYCILMCIRFAQCCELLLGTDNFWLFVVPYFGM